MKWRRIGDRGLASAQFEGPGSSGALDAVPITDATAEKVNKWNKNTLVWFPRTRRTLILDELLPAALSVPSAATELLPQCAATAGVLIGCRRRPGLMHFCWMVSLVFGWFGRELLRPLLPMLIGLLEALFVFGSSFGTW